MLHKLSDSDLIARLKAAVAEERRLLAELLEYLREVDRRKLYADFGHNSLWSFCVNELGYSEGCAMRRISSMRLLRELPELREELLEGRQTLSSLSQAQQFFRNENVKDPQSKRAVLEKLEGKSARECEKELQAMATEPPKVAFKLTISEELKEKLEKLRALRSHASLSYEDLLHYMADEMLKKLDPQQKPKSPPAPAAPGRHIPRATERFVWQRDQGRCTACGTGYFLQCDHITPYARGGSNEAANLRLRCHAHNQRAAILALGVRVTNPWTVSRR
jgi:hypothetical protein